MLDAATERRMKREHFEKYRDLARALGLEELSALVPASRERIERALASGDVHLNTISLASWDKAAGAETKLGPDWARRDPTKPCPTCGHKGPAPFKKRTVGTFPDRLSIEGVWAHSYKPYTVKGKRMRAYLSLAERVCVLKWVARYHVAGDAEPGGGDE